MKLKYFYFSNVETHKQYDKCFTIIIIDFNDFNQNQYCTNENISNDIFLRPDEVNKYITSISK